MALAHAGEAGPHLAPGDPDPVAVQHGDRGPAVHEEDGVVLWGRGGEHDLHVGLGLRPDGDPAHVAAADVVAHLEPEHVPVELERLVEIVDREEAVGDGDVHGRHATDGPLAGLLRS